MAHTGGDGLAVLRVHPSAVCTVVVSLSEDTVAQTVWFREDYQIQISDAIPVGLRAAVARHMVEHHVQECCTRSCAMARTWMPATSVSVSA